MNLKQNHKKGKLTLDVASASCSISIVEILLDLQDILDALEDNRDWYQSQIPVSPADSSNDIREEDEARSGGSPDLPNAESGSSSSRFGSGRDRILEEEHSSLLPDNEVGGAGGGGCSVTSPLAEDLNDRDFNTAV